MNEVVKQKVEDFFATYPTRKYKKGQVLILNGDEPADIFFILSGNIKQYDVDYRGEEIVLNIYKPGAFLPMSFALNGGASPHIYEADTDIEIKQAPSVEVVEFIKTNPDILLDLLSRVYRGTDSLLGRIIQLAGGSAKSRLSYELVIAAKRFGDMDGDSYELQITEKDLAARAGLSRETVSREMQKLKSRGLISLGSGRITIPELSALESTIE